MFILELNSGEKFSVTSIQQSRNNHVTSVQISDTTAEHDFDWYIEKLEAPNALNTIKVYTRENENGEPSMVINNFIYYNNFTMRLLPNGEKETSLTLYDKEPGLDN